MNLTTALLQAALAEAQRALPKGWHVMLVCVMPNASTKEGTIMIYDDLRAIRTPLLDALAAQDGGQ